MTTSRSDKTPRPSPAPNTAQPDVIYPQGVAQVEAERKRLGITQEEIERRIDASLRKPF